VSYKYEQKDKNRRVEIYVQGVILKSFPEVADGGFWGHLNERTIIATIFQQRIGWDPLP
jgi:hypothetical protein